MTWFLRQMVKAFADLPLVETRKITDDNADYNRGVLRVQAGTPRLK